MEILNQYGANTITKKLALVKSAIPGKNKLKYNVYVGFSFY